MVCTGFFIDTKQPTIRQFTCVTQLSIMSKSARIIGLIAAFAMLLFSGWMYQRTGDWVALVFLLGSLCYFALFFAIGGTDKD